MSTDLYQGLSKAPETGMPLIFAFHGTGGDERQFFGVAQQILPGAGVISPRGDVDEMGAARFFRRTGEGIYDMEDLAKRTAKMAQYVQTWKDAYPGRPAYGFGYSNGANILASVMIERPDLFDRAALMHPLIPWQPSPVAGLNGRKLLITAGQRDPICPLPLSQQLIDWFALQGADVTAHIHDGGHELRQSELTALKTLLQ